MYLVDSRNVARNRILGSGDLNEVNNRRISRLMDKDFIGRTIPSDVENGQESSQLLENGAIFVPHNAKKHASVTSSNAICTRGSGFEYSRSGNFSAFSMKNAKSSVTTSLTTSGNKIVRAVKKIFKRGDEYAKLKREFIIEMRQLSKLRHPCITTVMGAVIDRGEEPMLVMEFMQLGSLYDLLHNESMLIEGEVILPILRDIVQGLRFLHSHEPPVIHGDLKTPNILVDSKLHAKVADFGLSQKKRVGATGTPLWMAPELLIGKSFNSISSDCYSFGIMLYEMYSRKDPYEGKKINGWFVKC